MTLFRSAVPLPDLPDCSITDFVLRRAAELADKAALVEGPTGRVVTYGALGDRIRRLAGGLGERGVGPGTTWALMAPNVPEYAVVFHGLALAGATVTTLNPSYGAEEIAFQLRDSRASAVVTSAGFEATAREAAELAGVRTILRIGAGDLEAWSGAPRATQVAVPLGDHPVALPYSSGTTGFPKGVMLTHRNLVANLVQFFGHLPLDEDEVAHAVLPFFHIYGMQILMNAMLAAGATVVTEPRFDLLTMLERVQRYGVTRLFVVPPIVLALAKHPAVDEYDLSSVQQIFSGAAPLGGEIADLAARRLDCSIGQGYGMTEASPATHSTPAGGYRSGAVGTLLAGTEARVIDPVTGLDAGPGEPGELWVRGPQVMKGYLNNPEATAATVDSDGWLHTGDVARVDADGHTWIVDRLKELIKYNGFQVPPAELEALLLQHPGVLDVAVIGVPDEAAGELPKAFVVRSGAPEVDAAQLQAFVAGHVATYKQIRLVEFVEAIPKSASGKILRRELRTA